MPGAFGSGTPLGVPDGRSDWDVIIEAIDFERGESGTLTANSLTLLISPSSESN